MQRGRLLKSHLLTRSQQSHADKGGKPTETQISSKLSKQISSDIKESLDP
jgi:hypothetical protein